MYEIPEREGGDITAADMIEEEEQSEIVQFYKNSTIFVTGATGFLGKMCLEKLLRDCQDVKKIYVMVRAKKGKEVQTRFEEIFDGPNMEPLKRKNPNFNTKVNLIAGDCSLPNMGLSDEDRNMLIAETNCIMHFAATVRFDEKMRVAANINVKAVMDLLKMAKQMKNLKAMVHVSTAFSNCIRQEINEVFYPPPITAPKLLALIDALDDNKLDQITPILLEGYPNTYVYTKAVAEEMVQTEGKSLPLVVVRPSIVIASVKEPVAGWIDNIYGATGIVLGAALGLLRSLYCNPENVADVVPADYVVNCILAAAWNIAEKNTSPNKIELLSDKCDEETPIYNYVSRPEAKITWEKFMRLGEYHCPQIPTPQLVWSYCFKLRRYRLQHLIAVFFLQTIPAYLVDFVALFIGKKPMLVKAYQKINKFSEVIAYFSSREWMFSNQNVQTLWKKLNKKDREIFRFSLSYFDWDAYFYTYTRGIRTYLLKEPMSTVKEGFVRYYKLKVLHYTLITVVALIFLKLLSWLYGCLF